MTRANILIVEDDAWTAEQHIRVLQTAGYQAEYVTHTLDAIEVVDVRPPDVIILDLLLTGQNALTLLHELRSHADLASIPIILCTNSADALASEDVAVYGVRQVIDKATMQPADLITAVKRVL
jgi:PleD family two-component response regulator